MNSAWNDDGSPPGQSKNETRREGNRHLTRRAFLILMAEGAGLLALGGFLRLSERKGHFLRPPGAASGRDFLALCLKCRRCEEACPTGTITSVLVTESLASAGTPTLDFSLGYCNLCMQCIRVCPTGALKPTQPAAVRLGVAQVDEQKCIAWTWTGCTKCQQVCPLGAIVLDHYGRPMVDAGKCNGCGLCEYACPSSALRSYAGGAGKGIVVVGIDGESIGEL